MADKEGGHTSFKSHVDLHSAIVFRSRQGDSTGKPRDNLPSHVISSSLDINLMVAHAYVVTQSKVEQ
jgi:hypothetical protein